MLTRITLFSGLLLPLAQALVITNPTVMTTWDQTGTTPNYVQWALYPLTYPLPTSQFFDIYIRNGVAGMYEPALNQSIATKVDASQVTYFQVGDLSSFKSGSGYELFLSDPNDASIVYCDSEIFAIGTAAVSVSTNQLPSASATDGNSTSSAAETSQSSDSASETDSSSSSSDSASITDSPSSSTDSSSSPTSSPTSSVSSPSLQAATVPGGAAEQGLNLLDSAATAVGPALMLALVAGAVAIFA